jgi:hypothetical protein
LSSRTTEQSRPLTIETTASTGVRPIGGPLFGGPDAAGQEEKEREKVFHPPTLTAKNKQKVYAVCRHAPPPLWSGCAAPGHRPRSRAAN